MRKNFGCRVVNIGLWAWLFLALVTLGYYLSNGLATLTITNIHLFGTDLSLALRVDALSTIMFTMVTLLAAVVSQYSLRYLDGEEKQWYFYRYLLVTVLAVSFLVLSSNLVMFFAAWWGMSWGLHRLLLYNDQRPGAVYAARKKLLVSRLGDLALIGGIVLIYRVCGSFDFSAIFAFVGSASEQLAPSQNLQLSFAGCLLVVGAMTKSAQYPFHFWLPETMETPTPVSALMHAGVINAGGFLIIRLSPIMAHANLAATLLAVVGAFTAVYGALVMMTQNNIKKKLAYSTIAQMGMMMFACGIEAYSLALFHILAHSLYKAHAFLSTAVVIEENRQISLPSTALSAGFRIFVLGTLVSILAFGVFWQEGVYFKVVLYGSVLVLGLAQTFPAFYEAGIRLKVEIASALALALGAFLVVETGLAAFTANELRSIVSPLSQATLIAAVTSFTLFALGFWSASALMSSRSVASQRLYVSLWNDSYLGTRTTAILTRIWPA